MRTFIVYLAILSVVVCPYECAVKYAAAQSAGGENQIACCERCAAHDVAENSPAAPSEHQSKPSEDGKNCLCEGAVFDGVTRSDVDLVLQCALQPCVADVSVAPSAVGFSPNWDYAVPLDEVEGGRSMRIALRSLLL